MPAAAVLLFAAVAASFAVASVFRWQLGFASVFFLLLVEDIVRRALPGQPGSVLIGKEIVLVGTYLGYVLYRSREGSVWLPRFALPLIMFAAVLVAAAAVNPLGILPSLLGLHSYLFYIPVVWLTRDYFRSPQHLAVTLRRAAMLAVPLSALGLVQYFLWDSLPPVLLPLREVHAVHSHAFDWGRGVILPSSVFGSHFRLANVLLFLLLAGLAVLTGAPRVSGRASVMFAVVMAAVGIVVAASRGAAIGGGLAVLLLVLHVSIFQRRRILRTRTLLLAAAVVAGLWVIAPNTASFVFLSVHVTISQYGEWILDTLPVAAAGGGTLGAGLGGLSRGIKYLSGEATALAAMDAADGGSGAETGMGKVLWEIGLIGAASFLFLVVSIGSTVWSAVSKTPSEWRHMARTMALYPFVVFLLFQKGSQYLGDATTVILTWTAVGIVCSFSKTAVEGPQIFPRAKAGPGRFGHGSTAGRTTIRG